MVIIKGRVYREELIPNPFNGRMEKVNVSSWKTIEVLDITENLEIGDLIFTKDEKVYHIEKIGVTDENTKVYCVNYDIK